MVTYVVVRNIFVCDRILQIFCTVFIVLLYSIIEPVVHRFTWMFFARLYLK